MGMWDLMEDTRNPPQHMSAYMKYRYGGWIPSIPAIASTGSYALSPLTSPVKNCFRIASVSSTTQYYVVEYRKRNETFERSLPGEGLLVYRINTECTGNAQGPPDEVYVYRPFGTPSSPGIIVRAAYNADYGQVALTDSTNPSGFLADGSRGGLHLTEVGYLGDSITFRVSFPQEAQLSVDTRAVDFRGVSGSLPTRDTTFFVRNIGFATDSVEVTLAHGNVTPDSAIAISPSHFALGAGDSAGVTFTIRPPLLKPQSLQCRGPYPFPVWPGTDSFLESHAVPDHSATDVAGSERLPATFALDQNYPNPFNPTTTIRYHLPAPADVRLGVYDLLGREVAVLVNGTKDAGTHEVTFSAGNGWITGGRSTGLASGVFICKIVAGGSVLTRKLLFLQ